MTDVQVAPSTSGVASETTNPTTNPVSQTAPKIDDAALRDYKRQVKINGQERELSLEQAYQLASKAVASDEKFQTAAQKEKVANEILDLLGSNPVAALERKGLSRKEARDFLENHLVSMIEEDALSPEERQRKENEKRLKDYEEREKTEKMTKEQVEKERQVQAELSRFEDEIVQAFVDLKAPKVEIYGKWAAQRILAASQYGIELSAKEALKDVLNEVHEAYKPTLSSMDVAQLKKLLGAKAVAALMEDSVAKVKQAERPFGKPASSRAPSQASSEQQNQPMNRRDFFKQTRGHI
jgi:hypothetical protein